MARTFLIADFGCYTGPNNFLAMQNIVEALELEYRSLKQSAILEFQVLFNDLVDNNFNTLLKSLPLKMRYFAAAVPGSFYERLVPKASLHIAHSSYALHWLSKVPKEVGNQNSSAWNKCSIYCSNTVKEVQEAYFAQFSQDLNSFLNARAAEMVGGGLVVIQLPGLPKAVLPSDTSVGLQIDLLGSCLSEMTSLGFFSQERVDSYNLPMYLPSLEELEMLIQKNGHFTVERSEILKNPMQHLPFDAERTCKLIRAIHEDSIKDHFKIDNVDQLFDLYGKKLAESSYIFDHEIRKDADLFVLLKHVS